MVQNNYTFSIDPPVRVLAGSIDFAGVYLFYSEGTVCSIDLNVTANVSIKAGSPLGMLCMWILAYIVIPVHFCTHYTNVCVRILHTECAV